jgi:putative membrane protein
LPFLHIVGDEDWINWGLHLDVIFLCLFLEAGYLLAVETLRPRVPDVGRVKTTQKLYFTLGVAAVFLSAGSPLEYLAEHHLLSAHMVQHVALTLIAAPLLLAGIPGWLWEKFLDDYGLWPAARFLTNPLVAFSAFNASLLLLHLPPSIELQVEQWWFHLLAHVLLVGSGMLMWWPILSQVQSLPRLAYPLQMTYLFLQSLLPAVMGSFITFADGTVYDVYDGTQIWGMTAVEDQQFGGGLMKLSGSIILWIFIGVAFFKWWEQEQAEEKGPRWHEVEEELQGLGLTKR